MLHALTGDSHVAGPAGDGHPTPGWWQAVVGPGQALDPARWFVVAPNVLGGCQGSTGPAATAPDGRTWGSRFPLVTIRDSVRAETALADALGVERWACVVGGSMGGMRALEWAATEPDRVARLFLLASPASASAEQIGWCAPQLRGDPRRPQLARRRLPRRAARAGPARRAGHRPPDRAPVLPQPVRARAAVRPRRPRPGRTRRRGGRYAVESYLDHHADKLVHRFDAATYVRLTEMMNAHDVGRGRGGVPAGLARVTAQTLVAGVSSDRLYPLEQQEELAAGIPRGPQTPGDRLAVRPRRVPHRGRDRVAVARAVCWTPPGGYPDAETSRAVAAVTCS